jgi:cysteine-rich repeat protein
MTRRSVLGASVLAIATCDVAEAKLISCPAGRFEMRNVGSRGPAMDGMFLRLSEDGTAEIEGVCGETLAERRFGSFWHGRFSARWPACGADGIVRLRAKLADDCLALRGSVRTAAGARAAVTATRVAVCGDLLVSSGEDCDDGNTASGDCCVACQGEPGCWIPCETTSDCAPQAVCARYDDTCRATTGICRPPLGDECSDNGTFQVCGCDGNPYPSECAAWAVGVAIQGGDGLNYRVGKRCLCRPDVGLACRGGRFCEMPYRCTGGLRPSLGGICVEPPADCAGTPDLAVCGCDGRTYRNDCERLTARVQHACACDGAATPGARCGVGGPPGYGCDCDG